MKNKQIKVKKTIDIYIDLRNFKLIYVNNAGIL